MRNGSFWLAITLVGCLDTVHYRHGTATAGSCGAPVEVTVDPLYVHGQDWNDYVRRSDVAKDRRHQMDAACDGDIETGSYYLACVHGGELRQASVPSQSSCDGLTAEDSRGAFTWTCEELDGHAVLQSEGLSPGKGLADLVDGDGFLPISVQVRRGDCLVAESAPATWWQNPVLPIPDDTGAPAVLLDQPSAIYVADEDRVTKGMNLAADRVALVTTGDATLRPGAIEPNCQSDDGEPGPAPDLMTLVCSGSQHFIWLEAQLDGEDLAETLLLVTPTFSRLHRLRSFRHHLANLTVTDDRGLLVTDLLVAGGPAGAEVHGSRDLLVLRARAASHEYSGLTFEPIGAMTAVDLTSTNNGRYGVVMWFGLGNATLAQVLVANNGDTGLELIARAHDNYIQVTAIDNGVDGVEVNQFGDLAFQKLVAAGNLGSGVLVNGDDVSLRDVTAVDNAGAGIQLGVDSNDNLFSGSLSVGNNGTADCDVATDDNQLDDACHYGPDSAPAVSGLTAAGSFLERVLLDDQQNPADHDGLAAFDEVGIGWLPLDGPWRGWGPESPLPFPDLSQRSSCLPGDTCRIRDWRLHAGDTVFRGATLGPGACPAIESFTDSLVNTFLVDAQEIVGDDVGDEDGLCESHERCLFAPNLGAYQGEGALTGPCDFTDGEVQDVALVGYSQNGG